MIRKKPAALYLKTTTKVDSGHTVSVKGGILNNTTLNPRLLETTTTKGNTTTSVYTGIVATNSDNVLFTKKFVASATKFYSQVPFFNITSSNPSAYTVEESDINNVIDVKGVVGTYSASGLGASNKVLVKSTEGIIAGMVFSTQDNSTIADTNYVKVLSVDGPKALTLTSSSFSAAANSDLQFKASSSDGKLFVKTFKVIYKGNKNTVSQDGEVISFSHKTSTLSGAYVGTTPTAKIITDISINKNDISHLGETRTLNVTGSKGAIFSLTITKLGELAANTSVANKTYNFTTDTFTAAATTLANEVMDGSNVYSKSITFPSTTVVDEYQVLITAGTATTLDASVFGGSPSTPTFSIIQHPKTTVTISLSSSENASLYTDSGSDYGITDITSSGVRSSIAADEFSINWTVTTANTAGNAFNIIRQPTNQDFKGFDGFKRALADGAVDNSATVDLETTGHASLTYKVSYGTGDLVVGMKTVPGGVAISSITDANTIVLASAVTLTNHESLTFENGGTIVEFTDLKVAVNSTFATSTATSDTTSTLTASSGSSLFGLKTHDTAAYKSKLIGGLFTQSNTETDTVLNAFNPANGAATFSTAQTFDAAQKLEFNTSQTAVITGKGKVLNYGTLNTTMRLELDNILKLGLS